VIKVGTHVRVKYDAGTAPQFWGMNGTVQVMKRKHAWQYPHNEVAQAFVTFDKPFHQTWGAMTSAWLHLEDLEPSKGVANDGSKTRQEEGRTQEAATNEGEA